MRTLSVSHQKSNPYRRTSSGEMAFTIIEVLVCVAVLGVIVVPMAMAFSAGFRVTESTGASLHTSAARDKLAYRFTTDVASVDATGATVSQNLTCDTTPSGGGVPVLTLNSTTRLSANAVTSRVTYWVTGSGVNIDIDRRSCEGAEPGKPRRNGKSRLLAEKMGYPNAVAADIVHGPYDESIRRAGNPCNEYRCQLEVDGRYRYRVVAQRRAYGAGVPLEIGKIYSSSSTTPGGNGHNFEHFTPDNKSKSVEVPFTNQLTLAGGLDGPDLLWVRFKVRQMLTGKWLRCPNADPDPAVGDYTTCTFDSATPVAIVGRFDQVWKLPLVLGPGKPMGAGGEYKVTTEFTKPGALPGSPPDKTYGGVAGFPLWVDFYPDDVIYVAPGGTGDGRRPTTPIGTIDGGLKAAKTYNKAEILVADGDYFENISISGASYADNRAIVGRYSGGTTWLRGGTNTLSTKLFGTSNIGLEVVGKKNQRIRQMSINSGAPTVSRVVGQPGSSVFGLVARGQATVFGQYSTIRTDRGGAGGAGASGVQTMPNGCRGGHGVPNSAGLVDNYVTTRRNPDNAPDASTCKTGPSTRLAGDGGAGGHYVTSCALGICIANGQPGRWGRAGGDNASGGSGGNDSTCAPQAGGLGNPISTNPVQAAMGVAGSPVYSWTATAYTGATGGDGGAGVNGIGGAGAGGGAGTGCVSGWFYGASGGSGGEGGWGGPGGQGGRYGGAAIGLLIDGAGTVVRLDETPAASGGGGAGGNGGAGAPGTSGGEGGRAGLNNNDPAIFSRRTNGSAPGGNGGSGGSGGSGGAGGQGGLAANIIYQNGALPPVLNAVTALRPPATTSGAGGALGAAGQGGLGGEGGEWRGAFWFFWRGGGEIPAGRNAGNGVAGQAGAAGTPPASPCHLVFRTVGQAPVCITEGQ